MSRKVKPKDSPSKASHSELEELRERLAAVEKYVKHLRSLDLERVSAVVIPS